jgi:hyperosmotically inducible periplasmic protein
VRRISRWIAVSLLLAACAGNITPTRQLDDAALATSVRDALRNDPVLRGVNISVAARNGDVTLTGVVRTTVQRERATSVALSVPNVRSVNNLLALE